MKKWYAKKATDRDTGFMHNHSLTNDYIVRAGKRLLALEVLYREESWADVVRESQEIVELTLKGMLRACHMEVPRIHDVSSVLLEHKKRIPEPAQSSIDFLVKASRSLRRDRELAFYGSEDLTPSEFYTLHDADTAFEYARKTHQLVLDSLK